MTQQLLSPDWVAEATRRHVDNPNEPNPDWRQGYGFQFWMSRHGYRGDGAYGQFCIVLPEQDLVIATTADTQNMQGILDAVWAHLVPAVGEPLPDQPADAALAARLEAAELAPLEADPEPADPEKWTGREFVVTPDPEGPAGLTGVRLRRDDQGWDLELLDVAGPVLGRVGAGRWEIDEEAAPIAITGGWVGDRFRAAVIFLETPHRLLVECAGDTATARWRTVPLHGLPLDRMAVPRR